MSRLKALIILAGLLLVAQAPAHETDQFTTPPGREFADIGPFLSRWMYRHIERAVAKTNDEIRRRIDEKRGEGSLKDLHSPEHMARAVNDELPWAMDVIDGFDGLVHSQKMKDRYPGRIVGYKHSTKNILRNTHFALDPRQLFRIWLASTFKAYGTYMGADKLGHFTDMGMNYYRKYRTHIRDGLGEEEAVQKTVYWGTHDVLFSESGFLGYFTAGAYSNGDLAANFAGLMFYRNLTEPVMLKGKLQPPMLVLDGPYWKMADHVRLDSDFFAIFISDHLDEALNPSHFEGGMRSAVRKSVRQRAEIVLWRYADARGNQRPREWFENKLEELRTYYGVDYGHSGSPDELVSIASACFPEEADSDGATVRPVHLVTSAAANPQKRFALHVAAADGDAQRITRLLRDGVGVDAPDLQRRTPLHWAAMGDRDSAAAELLGHGAKIAQPDAFGATPLHLACCQRGGAVAKLLIRRGAPVSVRDDFGCTPLHDAARTGSLEVVAALLDAAAAVNDRDDYGGTPLHLACRNSHGRVAKLLVEKGADVNAVSSAGATPLHEAALAGDNATAKLLLSRGAKPGAVDKRGRTPAQVAAANNRKWLAELLAE